MAASSRPCSRRISNHTELISGLGNLSDLGLTCSPGPKDIREDRLNDLLMAVGVMI
jgi:hypothetical protein